MFWSDFSRNKWAVIVLSVGVLLSVGFYAVTPGAQDSRAATECAGGARNDAERVDCWLQIVFERLRNDGIASAYETFGRLYDSYPLFGASGCHQHAHKVGDTAYYELFVAAGRRDIEGMDFPQSATSCGYGFFHGFIEHLIQDHPSPAYVTTACEYLRGKYSGTMRDIGTICYHASGHGFTLAQVDTLPKTEWGKLPGFIARPLAQCEDLPFAKEREVEDCREGVFNVIADWMTGNEYGLRFDYEHPFDTCADTPIRAAYACYYELGQKLEPVIKDNPLVAERLVAPIEDKGLRETAFGVMVAGMMQRKVPLGEEKKILDSCLKIGDQALFRVCILSLANGMMEHGSPGKEYQRVLFVCSDSRLEERGIGGFCYDTLALRLSRFYAPEKKLRICGLFPADRTESCVATP
ncbi:MAG: hypothetical protein AAB597_01675 [Patescibacteria group bacterium]